MKTRIVQSVLFVWLALAFLGQPVSVLGAERKRRTTDERVLYNSYSLLHDLLKEQRRASKLLLLKLESKELDKLITQISRTASDGTKQLERFAKSDPKMLLEKTELPPGEFAVRKSIEDTKRKVLLKPFNPRFEFYLLLTQSEALTYGWHLAENAAELERNQERRKFLETIAEDMKQQHFATIELLRTQVKLAKD